MIFSKIKNNFRHLQLEIASAFPAGNVEKLQLRPFSRTRVKTALYQPPVVKRGFGATAERANNKFVELFWTIQFLKRWEENSLPPSGSATDFCVLNGVVITCVMVVRNHANL